MDRKDILEILFSYIKEDDPHRASKLLQIDRWYYTHSGIIERSGKKGHNLIAQVLSDKEFWEKVRGLHGVKLNRREVGKRLATLPDSDNAFRWGIRARIACDCSLEDEIRAIYEERKEELFAQSNDSLLDYHHLVRCCGEGRMAQFWSHSISGYLDKLDLRGRHPYEYGLDHAVGWRIVEAVEFFWNKIKSLPENEMGSQKKDEIFMRNAVFAAGSNFHFFPDILEFFLNQIDPDRYPELLKRDLEKNGHYGSLNKMIYMLSFDKFQELFDCLKPNDITEDSYYTRLYSIEIQNYSGHYANAAKELFLHIWTKEGFDNQRTFTLHEEMMNDSVFQGRFSMLFVEKGFVEPVWAMLDKANPRQIKEFMSSEKANYIRSILEQEDSNLLNKFLSYGRPVNSRSGFRCRKYLNSTRK